MIGRRREAIEGGSSLTGYLGRGAARRSVAGAGPAAAFLVAVVLLAACDRPDHLGELTSERDRLDERIECRIGSARQFERFCTFERGTSEDGPTLTLRKPDGGFRRLLVTDDGRGVVAADGAEPAQVVIIDEGRIEVMIGGDTFRLPATVGRR
jgi:hypothetical protein